MDVRRRPVLLTLALAVLATGPALYAAATPATTAPSLSGTVSGTDLKHHHIGVKVTKGAATYRGRTITVVLRKTTVTRLGHTVTPAAIKRNDRVTVTYRVDPKSHAVIAIKIVDTGPKPKPAPTPSPTPSPTQTAYVIHMLETGAPMYSPADLTVPVHSKVTVTDDSGDHTWTSGDAPVPSGTWDSGQMTPGQTFSFTFNTPGTFRFFCQNHYSYGMTGTVTVTG